MYDSDSERRLERRDSILERNQGAFTLFKNDRMTGRLAVQAPNGRRRSFHYITLVDTDDMCDDGMIILTYPGHEVTIYGRNLKELVYRLEEERVAEIIAMHDGHDFEPEDAAEKEIWRRQTFVENIEVRKI